MCDVCKAEGLDSQFMNGSKSRISPSKLFRVFKGQTATIKLCSIHDIQLFMLGEQRFLLENLGFLKHLNHNRRNFVTSSF
ncbi:hypothetical protein A9Q84_11065 [Halobacteriovorax marinus]|uniref:Uncharacterized protein n=1 Tax=Halobacteriovorax marinus TaxID=97084 RepID=A0A1Y5FD30_9BACT|nr:hypothetical protein A9Q84_11065 [Halobacteriovorax marinus]